MKTNRVITGACRGRAASLLAGCAWLFVLAEAGMAQAPPFEWARQAGGINNDRAYAIAVDGSSNVFVTGRYRATAAFGATNLVTQGENVFIAKYSDSGNLVWARNPALSASGSAVGFGIAMDTSGNAYFTGHFANSAVTFGSTVLTQAPSGDVFVAKYNSAGAVVWARQAGAASYGEGNAVAVDRDGNIHVVGLFSTRATFGPFALGSGGDYEAFHVKYDNAGNVLWAKKAGGTDNDYGRAVAVDSDGSSFLAGGFLSAPANVGGIALTNAGGRDIMIAKYDPIGNVVWARRAGGSADQPGTPEESATGVAVDAAGNAYLTGSFYGSVRFENTTITSAGASDIFVAKYNSEGTLLWVRRAGGASYDSANAIAVDAGGNSLVLGNFRGTANFGGTILVNEGQYDVFITKLDSEGSTLWARKAGFIFQDYGNGIALDMLGNIFIAGSFYDTANFDGTSLSGNLDEIFVAKLPAIAPVPPTITLQPQSQLVRAGSNATFSVVAGGTPPLAYQWRFNGTNLAGQTNASLTLIGAQPANEGPYRAVVSNAGGSMTSTVATLTLVYPPSVSAQPMSQIVTAGTDVNFTVTAGGTPPLSYRWQFNGANIAGGTNAVLVVSNAQPANGGNYMAIVTNAYGAMTSSVATLTVRYSLIVNVTGGGMVTRNPSFASYPPNLGVALTAVPTAGFVFNYWSGDAGGAANPLNITMTTNKSITAHFASTAVSLLVQGDGTVGRSPDRPFYSVGEQVALTAIPGRWHGFTRWADGPTVNPRVITIGASNSYTAIFSPTTAVETLTFENVSRTAPVGMPAVFLDGGFVLSSLVTHTGAVEVAMLTTFPNGTLLYTLDGSEPTLFSRIYEGPFTLGRPAVVRARAFDAFFAQSWEADPVQVVIIPEYGLNVMTGGGTVGASPAGGLFASNTLVTLTAAPAAGWSFLHWLGDATGTDSATPVVMNRTRCVEAVFGTTFSNAVSGAGAVVVEPAAALYPHGATVRLTAVPQAGHGFALWGGAAVGTNNPLVFTVTNANPVVSAAFAPLSGGQVALSVVPAGGGRVNASPGANRYAIGSVVTLTAVPDAGQSFLGWGGDAGGGANPLTVTMNASKVVTANFTKRPRLEVFICGGALDAADVPLQVSGEPGGVLVIEASADLQTWRPVATVTNRFGTAQWNDRSGAERGFYRVVLP